MTNLFKNVSDVAIQTLPWSPDVKTSKSVDTSYDNYDNYLTSDEDDMSSEEDYDTSDYDDDDDCEETSDDEYVPPK